MPKTNLKPIAVNLLPNTQPQYERAKATAQHLKISVSTLWHWAKTRHDFPKPVKAGERVTLFDLAAINE